LKIKTDKIEKIMQTLEKELSRMSKGLQEWCEHSKSLHNGFICPLEPFKVAEKTDGYRNRCEFTIGTVINCYE
jgi:tRNA (uracil-5-)-methyltransferase